ncbi:MAG: transglutaminase domain-containing protein [Planctomycetes bacterium]|nr:transglutaminase domain-containing protein [Planctomycetota bacterium]
MSEQAPPSRFEPAGVAAALALLLVALVLALGSQRPLTVVPVSLALIVTVFLPDTLRRSAHLLAYAALGGVFLLWQQSLSTILSGLGGTRFHGTFFAAHTCLSCGALALFAPRSVRGRIPWGLMFGIAALCFTGGGFPNWIAKQASWKRALPGLAEVVSPRMFYAGVVFLFGSLALVGFRAALPHRPGPPARGRAVRWGLLAVVLALSIGLSEGAAYTTRENYQKLSSLYVKMARGLRLRASGGFSGQAELGDVLAEQGIGGGRGVALEVISKDRPGLLKGRVFLRYTGRGWDVGKNQAGVPAETDDFGRWTIPGRGEPAPEQAPDLTVRPAARYEAILFTPLLTQAVEGPSAKVILHAGGVLHSTQESSADGYRVWTSPAPVHREAGRDAYLELPEDPELLAALDEHIAAAKLRDEAGAPLRLDKVVGRLARHFDRRYQYKFGIQFEEGSDPLTQFLRVKDHGHCELFASSGALILRRLGFKTRYVTGFVCIEQNEYDKELWIARNRMAHAWVEVYHPALGWREAEFTPGSAIPQVGKATWMESLTEWLQGKWTRFKAIPWRELPAHAVGLVRDLLSWVFAAWWRVAILLSLGVAFVLWRRRRRVPPAPLAGERTLAPGVEQVRQSYLAREGLLSPHGLSRAPSETLLAQALRLQICIWPEGLILERSEVVDAIEAFAAARYGVGAGEALAPPEAPSPS